MQAGIPTTRCPSSRSIWLARPTTGRAVRVGQEQLRAAFAAAWTPNADGGFFGWLTGSDHFVRGGYFLVYDRIGQALATQFNNSGSFGLSTPSVSPVNENNETTRPFGSRRSTSFRRPYPGTARRLPGHASDRRRRHHRGDRQLDQTPYSHAYNLVVRRELGRNYCVRGRLCRAVGRNQLIRRDATMPLNLVDTKSGVDYFTAAKQLITQARAVGDPQHGADPVLGEHVPGRGGRRQDGHAGHGRRVHGVGPDWITALWDADQFCSPACAVTGPSRSSTSSTTRWPRTSSLARSGYNSMQLALRQALEQRLPVRRQLHVRPGQGPRLVGRAGRAFTRLRRRRLLGFLINSWDPDQQYGTPTSTSVTRSTSTGLYELPFGQGKQWAGTPGFTNALIGDWSLAGIYRWTSGFPFNVYNCRSCWATNWNLQGNASLVTPGVLPETGTTKDIVNDLPSPFTDPEAALEFFRRDFPGESGLRNVLRGDGYFTIDLSLAKAWTMPWSSDHKLRFRWDVFN